MMTSSNENTGDRWIPLTKASDVFFHLRLNNRDAGDLSRFGAHCDVTVMSYTAG